VSRVRLQVVALLLTAGLVVAGCSAKGVEDAATLDRTGREAELVVIVEPTGETESFPAADPPITYATVAVEETLKGDPPSRLLLTEAGYQRDPGSVPRSRPLVKSGEQYLLFLVRSDRDDAPAGAHEAVDNATYRVSGNTAKKHWEDDGAEELPGRVKLADIRERANRW
jgi:hypothetical protein